MAEPTIFKNTSDQLDKIKDFIGQDQNKKPELTFGKLLISRFQDLILECFSFKFMIFLFIFFSTKNMNMPYISEILTAVSGSGVLAYKLMKDKNSQAGTE